MTSLNNTLSLFLLGLFSSVNLHAEESEFAAVRDKLNTCVACHGEKGQSKVPSNPILAGQEFYYLYVQLKDFAEGRRESAIMSPIASSMSKDEMKLVAKYFYEQKWPDIKHKPSKENIKTGQRVINSGQCVACHLGSLKGNSRVPRLAGQHPEYLVNTMLDFKNNKRNNSPSKNTLLNTYTEEEIRAVAGYIGGYNKD